MRVSVVLKSGFISRGKLERNISPFISTASCTGVDSQLSGPEVEGGAWAGVPGGPPGTEASASDGCLCPRSRALQLMCLPSQMKAAPLARDTDACWFEEREGTEGGGAQDKESPIQAAPAGIPLQTQSYLRVQDGICR